MSGTKHNMDLDGSKVLRMLRRDGWRVLGTKQGHIKCYSPCGRFLVVASGRYKGRGSDRRALPNFLRDLKNRAGWTPSA